jgi:hypothetical protein
MPLQCPDHVVAGRSLSLHTFFNSPCSGLPASSSSFAAEFRFASQHARRHQLVHEGGRARRRSFGTPHNLFFSCPCTCARAEEISPHCSLQNKKKSLLHKTRISPSLFRLDTSRTRSKMSAAEPSSQRATRSRSPRKSRAYTMPTPIPLVLIQTHFLPSPLSCTILQFPAPGTTLEATIESKFGICLGCGMPGESGQPPVALL